MIFFELSGKMIFLFPEIWSYSLDVKRKMLFLKKNIWKYDVFSKCSEKMVFPKKFAPEHGIFCNIWKYGISFFREIWYFFLSGKWKKVIFINKYMEIWYFLYICINVTTHQRSVALLAKKKQCPRPENIRLKVIFPASLKKIIFILENVVFLLKYHIDRRPRKGSRSSHRRCSIREGVVPGSLFKWSYRLKACNFIKKEALAQLLSCEYCEISKNTFFTEHLWAAASGVLMILCYFMETFIDVFIYCLPMKKK